MLTLQQGESPLISALLSQPDRSVLAYYDDPAAFTRDCICWAPGKGLTAYQEHNLGLLVEHGRLAVRGPHGLGKTATNALTVLWFALTRDAKGIDWKIITTASAWRQLEKYLWPEVHKWSRLLDWEKIGRKPFTQSELMFLGLRLTHGEAFAVACTDPATIEGAHADSILYVYDEAKTIPPETFDASEGAFAGAGTDTAQEAFAIASSTPGPPSGRFYEIHTHSPGLEDWHAVHVTLEDTIRAGRVSEEWAKQRARQWGADSAVYINRVRGEFCAEESDGVIPLAWVEAANERYRLLEDEDFASVGPLIGLGGDIARSGKDRTVLALRHGDTIRELRRLPRQGTMETAGQILGVLRTAEHKPPAVIDVIGIGAGVVDRLREKGENVIAFNASEGTKLLDRSGELGYTNCRACAWWNLREMLDPDYGMELALPPDDLLTGDLTAPTWRVMSGGRIQIESKDDIRKRLGRSTDDGDAVVQAYWTAKTPNVSAPIFGTGQSTWAPMRQKAGGF